MGTIDFRQPIASTTKTNMKLFLIAAVLIASVFAEPESEAKADAWYGAYGYGGYPYAGTYGAWTGAYGLGYNGYASGYRYLGKRSADSDADAKPWLTYGAGYGYAGYPYAATYGALLPQSLPTLMLPMLPQSPPMLELTSLARDLLTPMLKLSHGWPILTTDMLDTHMPPPMVPMLPQSPPTLMLLTLPHTPPMELTSSAKDPLKPNQNPGMELTDTLPHTPPTDVTDIVLTDTDGKNYQK